METIKQVITAITEAIMAILLPLRAVVGDDRLDIEIMNIKAQHKYINWLIIFISLFK